MLTELTNRLEKVAFAKTIPFCYGCYKEAPTGRCNLCHSDDLMRLLPEFGCEYGVDWVIQHLLQAEVETPDLEETFEQSVSGCYSDEVKIGWINVDTCSAIKALDPVSWDMAKSEWMDMQVEEELLVTFDNGSNHYWTHDIESFLEKAEMEIGEQSIA